VSGSSAGSSKAETEFRAILNEVTALIERLRAKRALSAKTLKREIHFDRFSLEIFEDQTPLFPRLTRD
jgi:hypothetical protein